MAQDPLSRVASWITPATPGEVADESLITSPPEDPVIALIAEQKRLEVLWIAADGKGHDRQAKVLDEQMGAILNQLRNRNITPITLAGAIAMLEEGLRGGLSVTSALGVSHSATAEIGSRVIALCSC